MRGIAMLVYMTNIMKVLMLVTVAMSMRFIMMTVAWLRLVMVVVMLRLMLLFVIVRGMVLVAANVNVKLAARDTGFLAPVEMEVIPIQAELKQFGFQQVEIDAEIHKSPNQHVAADAAEEVEVDCFHTFQGQRMVSHPKR